MRKRKYNVGTTNGETVRKNKTEKENFFTEEERKSK
jgi:hypothetical protein